MPIKGGSDSRSMPTTSNVSPTGRPSAFLLTSPKSNQQWKPRWGSCGPTLPPSP